MKKYLNAETKRIKDSFDAKKQMTDSRFETEKQQIIKQSESKKRDMVAKYDIQKKHALEKRDKAIERLDNDFQLACEGLHAGRFTIYGYNAVVVLIALAAMVCAFVLLNGWLSFLLLASAAAFLILGLKYVKDSENTRYNSRVGERKKRLEKEIEEKRREYDETYRRLVQEEQEEIDRISNSERNNFAANESNHEAAIRKLEREEEEEIRQLKSDVKKKVDAYGQRYWEEGFIPFVVQWIMSEFADVIEKADRSPYYPQIKAEMSFRVYANKIEAYKDGRSYPSATYDLERQGLSVDDDPLSLSALAYVLGSKLVVSAEERFPTDPGGGGKPVITSEWDDEQVGLFYSAPNGVSV